MNEGAYIKPGEEVDFDLLVETARKIKDIQPVESTCCSLCGKPWQEHDWGVPAPTCP